MKYYLYELDENSNKVLEGIFNTLEEAINAKDSETEIYSIEEYDGQDFRVIE